MHKIASLAEFALMLLIENLAFPCSIELTVSPRILGPQLFNPMCEFAAILIRAVALFHKIFTQLHLDLIHPHIVSRVPLSVMCALALASFEGVTLPLILLFISLTMH